MDMTPENAPQTQADEATDALVQEGASALPQEELDRLTDALVAAFKTVFDPEIPVDIYELGLIYKVDVSDDRDVVVEMIADAKARGIAIVGIFHDVEVRDSVADRLFPVTPLQEAA